MNIDLSIPGALTEASVAALLASVSDDRNWQLRVSELGLAELSEAVGNDDMKGLRFRLETWIRGNSYVGPQAAADPKWVAQVYQDLKENWPNPKSPVIDH